MSPSTSSRSFVPQRRDQGLAEGSTHRVELAGAPREIAWPTMCPCCGEAASETIAVTKMFIRNSGRRMRRSDVDDVRSLVKCTIAVPFCGRCAARHREMGPPIGPVRQLTSYMSTAFVIPLVIALFAVATYFAPALVGSASALLSTPNTEMRAAFFAMMAVVFAVLTWHQTRHKRVPRQTEVTTSFDFSDNLGNVVRGEHRIYAIRNAAFAEAFRRANSERLWTDEMRATGQRRENVVTMVVVAVLALAGLFYLLTR